MSEIISRMASKVKMHLCQIKSNIMANRLDYSTYVSSWFGILMGLYIVIENTHIIGECFTNLCLQLGTSTSLRTSLFVMALMWSSILVMSTGNRGKGQLLEVWAGIVMVTMVLLLADFFFISYYALHFEMEKFPNIYATSMTMLPIGIFSMFYVSNYIYLVERGIPVHSSVSSVNQ